MTDTDPYTGIRTRENIVESAEEAFQEVNRLIAARHYTTLRQRLADPLLFSGARAMEEIDAEAVAEEPRPSGRSQRRTITLGQPVLRPRTPPQPAFERPYHPQSPPGIGPALAEDPSRAFEQNLVPAEDVPAHERIVKLKQLVEDMYADWCKLNEIYNVTAQKRDWCSDYEERQHNYNEQFKVLRLVGRPRNWYGSTSNWKSLDGSDFGDNG